jgi:hypothetical protein
MVGSVGRVEFVGRFGRIAARARRIERAGWRTDSAPGGPGAELKIESKQTGLAYGNARGPVIAVWGVLGSGGADAGSAASRATR